MIATHIQTHARDPLSSSLDSSQIQVTHGITCILGLDDGMSITSSAPYIPAKGILHRENMTAKIATNQSGLIAGGLLGLSGPGPDS